MIVPDAIEPIVGWRCWSLNDAGQLESPIQDSDTPWLPGERKEAKCSSPFFSWLGETSDTEGAELDPTLGEYDFLREHQAPLESCCCGIHAAKDLETLRAFLSSGPIVGEVYLWGKVIPGENGYRAQYAYPKSLRLVADRVVGPELRPLRAYCADVGVITQSEAWGSWPERVMLYGRFGGSDPADSSLGGCPDLGCMGLQDFSWISTDQVVGAPKARRPSATDFVPRASRVLTYSYIGI